MRVEVLISTMNLKDEKKLINRMNVNKCIIINQVKNENDIEIKNSDCRVFSYCEKGLSKSRNRAINKSSGEIIAIADDDMTYCDDYEKIIISAYEKYRNADIIAFHVENSDSERGKKKRKEKKSNFLTSMKIQSVQLTMRRESIIKNNLLFNENFGAGAKWFMGEENIFLYDCLKKGLKIYYVPDTIARLNDSESTWFRGFNKEYFIVKGGVYYEMSKIFCPLFILQFAIRKKKKYKNEMSIIEAIKFMNQGKKKRKKEKKMECKNV